MKYTTILVLIIGMIIGWVMAISIVAVTKEQPQPVVDLPEELMSWVSDIESKPDTVLIFQSRHNDSLYIRFMK